jgi:hypothetical protein
MVPPKSDPKWTKFISSLGSVKVNDLSARMLISRLKMKTAFDSSETCKQQAISDAYDFFMKNQVPLKEDINLIFG